MENPKFRCGQSELYSAGRMVIRAAVRQLTDFSAFKAKYDAAYFTALETEVAEAEALPDDTFRTANRQLNRIATVEAATTCLNLWQNLKAYIEDTPEMQGAQLKPSLEAAGSPYYADASGFDWESVSALMNEGKNFMTLKQAELTAGNNMPATFPTDFDSAYTDFLSKWQQFQDAEEINKQQTQQKVEACNALYDKIIQICKDGQRIYRSDEATREQFVWESVLYLARGAGIAGLRGTVLNLSTQQPVLNATVLIVETGDTGQPDQDGTYRITGVPAGNYTVRCTADGYNPIEQPFAINSGTISTLDFRLTPA